MKTLVKITGKFAEEVLANILKSDKCQGGFDDGAYFLTNKHAQDAIDFATISDGTDVSILIDEHQPTFELMKVYKKDIDNSDLLQILFS